MLSNTPLGRLGNSTEFAIAVEGIIKNPYATGDTWRLDGGIRLPYMWFASVYLKYQINLINSNQSIKKYLSFLIFFFLILDSLALYSLNLCSVPMYLIALQLSCRFLLDNELLLAHYILLLLFRLFSLFPLFSLFSFVLLYSSDTAKEWTNLDNCWLIFINLFSSWGLKILYIVL